MNKIIPQIFNGTNQILLSETFVIVPSKGLKIVIPTGNSNSNDSLTVSFKFIDDVQNKKSTKIQMEALNKEIQISLSNFGNHLASGVVKPIPFTIGDKTLNLLFGGHAMMAAGNKTIIFTVTISEGAVD